MHDSEDEETLIKRLGTPTRDDGPSKPPSEREAVFALLGLSSLS